jgi:transposase InsO family protein
MTTRANSQFPRPDFHRQDTSHYGLRAENAEARGNNQRFSDRILRSTSALKSQPKQTSKYAATAYTEPLASRGDVISMAAVGKPEENGYAERLMRTIREKEIDLCEYPNYGDAFGPLGRFLHDAYNRKRIHSAAG